MLVRHDLDIENIGKQAQLIDDQSPFQIGTQGRYAGVIFTLQGRLRRRWDQGVWTEWYAWFNDGTVGWLADAQGFLSVYREAPKDTKLPPREKFIANQSVVIGNSQFSVADIKESTIDSTEGELPFVAPAGRRTTTIDLNGVDQTTATVEFADEGVRYYSGHYVKFEDLKLAHLRKLDGW